MNKLYEADLVAWAEQQATLLREGKLSLVDVDNLAEEIEDVSKREHRAVESHLIVLLSHLLKWHHQPQRRNRSWIATMTEQRDSIDRALLNSPSMIRLFDDEPWLADMWRRAALRARLDTGLSFPPQWSWSVKEVFDPEYLPD